MPKYSDVIYEFLIRLPFFFAVHTALILFADNISPSTPVVLFLSFLFIFVLDMAIKKPRLSTLFGLLTGGVLLLLKLPVPTILVWCVTVFKDYLNANVQFFFWIMLHIIAAIFIPPARRLTIMAYILIMAASFLICGLMHRLGIFMYSTCCREASKKTIRNVMARHYRLIVPLLILIFIAGFIAMLPEYPEEIQINFNEPPPPAQQAPGQQENGIMDFTPTEDDIIETPSPEEPALSELFWKIMRVTGYIIGILFACLLLFLLFFAKKEKTKAPEFLDYNEDIVEVPLTEENKLRRKNKLPDLKWIIRRLFRLKVRRQKRNGLRPKISDTPNILAVQINKFEDISALNRLYHRARYSAEEINRTDLNEINIFNRKV